MRTLLIHFPLPFCSALCALLNSINIDFGPKNWLMDNTNMIFYHIDLLGDRHLGLSNIGKKGSKEGDRKPNIWGGLFSSKNPFR